MSEFRVTLGPYTFQFFEVKAKAKAKSLGRAGCSGRDPGTHDLPPDPELLASGKFTLQVMSLCLIASTSFAKGLHEHVN